MWKKPSIEKPDFKKLELNEMSENEAFEISGGSTVIEDFLPIGIIVKPFPRPLGGIVARPFDIIKTIKL